MQNLSDLRRHRKTSIKSGGTDKKIISGVKKATSTIKNIPKKANKAVGKMVDNILEKGTKKIMKSKWWNN